MKGMFAAMLGLMLVVMGLPAYAATAENGYAAVELSSQKAVLLDFEGTVQAETEDTTEDAGQYAFSVMPGRTYYLCLGPSQESTSLLQAKTSLTEEPVTAAELGDSDLFRLKNEKSGSGAGLVSVAQYNDKSIGDSGRCSWLQFVVANTVAKEELQAVCNMTLSARRSDVSGRFAQDDFASIQVTLYIQTPAQPALGDGETVQLPETYGPQEKVWENLAKISSIGAQLEECDVSLSAHEEFLPEKLDIAADEVFLRDFTGAQTELDSRVLLTLYDPWEAIGEETPESCRIYEYDAAGRLLDVTERFTRTKEDGMLCWQMRTRRLGCYLFSSEALSEQQEKEAVFPERPDSAVREDELRQTASQPGAPFIHSFPKQTQEPEIKNFYL